MIRLLKNTTILIAEAALFITLLICVALLSPTAHKQILRKYISSKVVLVTEFDPKLVLEQGGGTGFHVRAPSGKTYIMTNRHVCNMSRNGKIWVKNQDYAKQTAVIAVSDSFDLCLLEGISGVEGLKVGEAPYEGQTIAYLGYPRLQPRTFTMGEAVGNQVITIEAGIVGKDITIEQCKSKDSTLVEVPEILTLLSDLSEDDLDIMVDHPLFKNAKKVKVCYQRNTALVTTLTIYGGASGSPIIDIFGNLVAVVYAAPSSGGWGYGVTMVDIKNILNGR